MTRYQAKVKFLSFFIILIIIVIIIISITIIKYLKIGKKFPKQVRVEFIFYYMYLKINSAFVMFLSVV